MNPLNPLNPGRESSKIILPHSGYRKLIAFQKSEVIYQGTVVFCRRFLPAYGDRTVDQMTQAARSCKQNIAEGSAAAGTSLETQLKLTNVARASLDELLEDYVDYLKSHGIAEWAHGSSQKETVRAYARQHATWDAWQSAFETRSAGTLGNVMIVLIQQCRFLLERLLHWQETDFLEHGGVRERMHTARTEARGETWDKGMFSMLDAAPNADELERRLDEIIARARKAAAGIRAKKGWRRGGD